MQDRILVVLYLVILMNVFKIAGKVVSHLNSFWYVYLLMVL